MIYSDNCQLSIRTPRLGAIGRPATRNDAGAMACSDRAEVYRQSEILRAPDRCYSDETH